MSPYTGFCITCDSTIEGETKESFGDALIEHHQENRGAGGIISRCNVFQCVEKDEEGKVIGEAFGLEAIMEIVCRAWTGTLWYQKQRKR